jgi:hypothetical protein
MTDQAAVWPPRLRDSEQLVTLGLGVRLLGPHTGTSRILNSHIAFTDRRGPRTTRGIPASDLAGRPPDVARTRIMLPSFVSYNLLRGIPRPLRRAASQGFRPWILAARTIEHQSGEPERRCGAGTPREARNQHTHPLGRSDRYLSCAEGPPMLRPGTLPGCPRPRLLTSPVPDQSADGNPRRGPSDRCQYRADAGMPDSLKGCHHSPPGTLAASKVILSLSVGRQG